MREFNKKDFLYCLVNWIKYRFREERKLAAINSADVGFEKQLWASADILRGNIDASEYKHVVLGLIFLKYISDKFEARYQELVEEGDGFEEDIDEYSRMGVFYVPPSVPAANSPGPCPESMKKKIGNKPW